MADPIKNAAAYLCDMFKQEHQLISPEYLMKTFGLSREGARLAIVMALVQPDDFKSFRKEFQEAAFDAMGGAVMVRSCEARDHSFSEETTRLVKASYKVGPDGTSPAQWEELSEALKPFEDLFED